MRGEKHTMNKRARIEVLGVCRYEPTPDVIRQQARVCVASTPSGQLAAAKRSLAKIVLVEVLAHHTRATFQGNFGQPGKGMNSFDWNLRILTLDGTEQSKWKDLGKREFLRLAFFVHDFHPSQPLKSELGVLALPAIQSMPSRLEKAMPYDVCD